MTATAKHRVGYRPAVLAGLLAATLAAVPGVAAPSQPAPREGASALPANRFLPSPDELADPRERPVLAELFGQLVQAGDEETALTALDRALTRLPEPTKLRGFVQLNRAGLLLGLDRFQAAKEAIEESIRLLPDYSAPLIVAASIFTYANDPGRGADYLLRASRIDPGMVARVDDYEIDNVMRRLSVAREKRRMEALSDRLLEIGWIGSKLSSRSTLVRQAIERRLTDGDLESARSLVPKLLLPSDSYALLTNNQAKAIWADLETWGGRRLEKQWAMYLGEARDRWSASKQVTASLDYASALRAAGHDKTIIRDLLPVLSRKLDPREDQDAVFLVHGVAGALAREGRWQEMEALFERTQRVWPLGSEANALNIAANQAGYLLAIGQPEEGLRKIDAVLSETRKWEINADALAAMQHTRACILHELGRAAEAKVAAAMAAAVQYPADVAYMHLCMGDTAAARQALLKGLESPTLRQNVLGFFQKNDHRMIPSDYARRQSARVEALKADPALLARVADYGRVLPFAANEGAPLERP